MFIVKKLDKLTIAQIENNLNTIKKDVVGRNAQFYQTLEYLETTKRFKENTVYKESTFEKYIGDMFMLRMTTYLNARTAYLKHATPTRDLGPNLVISVRKKCGVMEAEKVFAEIKKKKSAKKGVFTRDNIQEIINKHAKPVKEKPVKKDLSSMLTSSRETVSEQNGIIKQQAIQISKLKMTVADRDAKIMELQKRLEMFNKLSMPLLDMFNGRGATLKTL